MPFDFNKKVLVVDDMMTMRKIISKMLKQFGFTHITEADDGATAWPMIQLAAESGEPFELIVSDWNMPKLSGYDLLLKVRETEEINSTPFLLVTAEGEKNKLNEAIGAGVSNVVIKPFNPEELKNKIEKVFADEGI